MKLGIADEATYSEYRITSRMRLASDSELTRVSKLGITEEATSAEYKITSRMRLASEPELTRMILYFD
ncbi:hypothetical protein J6590_086084 [Homalodisca vitripennis]|nr:hypothetical protein J6590_086084 [Homalodisca vitripennis]